MSLAVFDLPQWPRFSWDVGALVTPLVEIRHLQGRFLGRMESLGVSLREEVAAQALAMDAAAVAAFSGVDAGPADLLDLAIRQVRAGGSRRRAVRSEIEGVVALLGEASCSYQEPLTTSRLLDWHRELFPKTSAGGAGQWRQSWSGGAPNELPSFRIEKEVETLVQWVETPDGSDGVMRAFTAYGWLMALRPFEKGTKRVAAALLMRMLARVEGSSYRFYSLFPQMAVAGGDLEARLDQLKTGGLDLTGWSAWLLLALSQALEQAKAVLEPTFKKARFWDDFATAPLNERQRAVMNLLLDGDEDKLTTSKWAKIMKCSQDTALRDIQGLMDLGLLSKDSAGGRSTRYLLAA
ncbi:MAG: DUF4172 domain-containing protein [Bdellovibrionales bacterium]